MGNEIKIRKPKRDALIIQMEKAYRGSWQYQLNKLVHRRTLYRRRVTIAQAGLDRTQQEIEELLTGLARPHLVEAHAGKEQP